jgi:UPF0288 family protein (methanogenesis marker protein 3)
MTERERKRERETEEIIQKDPCGDLEISLVDSSGNLDFIIDVQKGMSDILFSWGTESIQALFFFRIVFA